MNEPTTRRAEPTNHGHQVQALILASGRGRRMGGPKALLCWDHDRTLLEIHASSLLELGLPVTVVTRQDIAERLGKLSFGSLPGLSMLVSRKPDAWGPAGSIAAAVQSPGVLDRSWTLLLLVDQVPLAPSILRRLLDVCDDDHDAIRPIHEGRGGHPVIVRTPRLREFFSHDDQRSTLRDLMCAPAVRRLDLPVDSPDVRRDLDTPDDWFRLRHRSPSFC